MGGQRHERTVVDDVAVLALAGHRRLHAIVEDLVGHAAQVGEGGDVAAQDRLQVLVQDEARPEVARVAQHHREQPHDAHDTRLVGEGDDKAGEVDLGLLAGRRLEADLVGLGLARPDRGHEPLHRGVGARVAALTQLASQAHGAQIREGRDALAQIVEIGRELARASGLAGAVGRRFEAALDVLADRLWVTPGPAGDGGDGQALSVQVQDHEEFSQQDHPRRSRPIRVGGHGG